MAKKEKIIFDQLIKSSNTDNSNVLTAATLNSPLGKLLTIGDETKIYMLQCLDESQVPKKIKQFATLKRCTIKEGHTKSIDLLEKELIQYFNGDRNIFKTKIEFIGTEFQISVWKCLQNIAYGKTVSYAYVAKHIGKPNAVRAVGTAIGANPFIILVPCHRVINTSGKLGGFSCGLYRKKILLKLENQENMF